MGQESKTSGSRRESWKGKRHKEDLMMEDRQLIDYPDGLVRKNAISVVTKGDGGE